MTDKDDVTLADELERLIEAARGCEFDLVPSDGPIARIALFMHENGDRIIAALKPAGPALTPDEEAELVERINGNPYLQPTEPTAEVEDRIAKAELSRTVYARALEKMRGMLDAVNDELEDEGDRVYLGSTNHADLLREAWETADAIKWDEVLAHTQPDHPLAETNLHLQSELTRLQAENARLEALLGELQACEASYRKAHDLHGDGSSAAGRRWDLMRRAGDNARTFLATLGGSDA